MRPIRTLTALLIFGSIASAEDATPEFVVCRIQHQFKGGPPSREAMAFTPDGKHLVTLSTEADGKLHFWDSRTGQPSKTMTGVLTQGNVRFSADGRYLAAVSNDPRQHLAAWDAGSGERLFAPEGNVPPSDWLSLSLDGKQLVGARFGRKPALTGWDFESGKRLFEAPLDKPLLRFDSLSEGERFLIATEEGLALYYPGVVEKNPFHFFRLKAGRKEYSLSADRKFVLATSSQDRSVDVYEVDSRLELLHVPTAFTPTCMAFAPHGRTFAIASAASGVRRIQVFDWPTGKPRVCFLTEGVVAQICFSADGYRLASWEALTEGYIVRIREMSGIPLDVVDSWPSNPGTLELAWADLGDATDGRKVFAAINALVADEDAESLLATKLRPAESGDRAEIAPNIRKLDDARFTVREQAFRKLERFGAVALPELRQELLRTDSPEQARTLMRLIALASIESKLSPRLREQRAVFVLQRIGSPKCEAILRSLSKGLEGHPLTEDARRALARLGRS